MATAVASSLALSSTLTSSVTQFQSQHSVVQSSRKCRFPSAITCEASRPSEAAGEQAANGPTRRAALLSLTSAAVAAASLTAVDDAQAADIIQRAQRGTFVALVQQKFKEALAGPDADVVPELLRLALNDAFTYDKATKTGGVNASILTSEELSRPENKGLEKAVAFLATVKDSIDADVKGGPIGRADLIAFGGQAAAKRSFLDAAIVKAGGDLKKGKTLNDAFGSSSQWGFFDKQIGRTDATEADPSGRVPDWSTASVEEMKAKFAEYGLKPRQLAVLSAFLGPDQAATEAKLLTDPETAPYVQKYQKSRKSVSQTDYEVDLITTYTKVAQLGKPIFYEAYTYEPNRPKFRY
eukprot:TRINITY_DN17_c0_g2_i1.p1 TRINITY_DN17_c0_g2~~TRINITY_DN17_c0_g2_i1.p1  ORF type:complete len:353 (+),score=70.64 TRINITY_DN17_c0_g2_i1:112-1170(+)